MVYFAFQFLYFASFLYGWIVLICRVSIQTILLSCQKIYSITCRGTFDYDLKSGNEFSIGVRWSDFGIVQQSLACY